MLLGDAGASNNVAALEYAYRTAGAGQVGSGDKTVMSTADDDSVVTARHHARSLSARSFKYCIQSQTERSRLMYPSAVSKKMTFQLENSCPEG